MDQHDARRIAETANALRPDWPIRSLMTILADFRHLDPLDVHLAVVWIAYDSTIDSPAILRATTGPWWRLARQAKLGTPELPTWRAPEQTTPPASPATITAMRAELDARLATIPPPIDERTRKDIP